MAESYGIVVEGSFDSAVITELIHKLVGGDQEVIARIAGGVRNLMAKFPAQLRVLENIKSGQPVEKAIVVRDAQNKNVADLYGELRGRIRGLKFRFPQGVHFYVIRQELEALLLADEEALNAAIKARGGRVPVRIPNQHVENIQDPKSKLQRLLARSRVLYTAEFAAEVVRSTDIGRIEARCPSFSEFVHIIAGT